MWRNTRKVNWSCHWKCQSEATDVRCGEKSNDTWEHDFFRRFEPSQWSLGDNFNVSPATATSSTWRFRTRNCWRRTWRRRAWCRHRRRSAGPPDHRARLHADWFTPVRFSWAFSIILFLNFRCYICDGNTKCLSGRIISEWSGLRRMPLSSERGFPCPTQITLSCRS